MVFASLRTELDLEVGLTGWCAFATPCGVDCRDCLRRGADTCANELAPHSRRHRNRRRLPSRQTWRF